MPSPRSHEVRVGVNLFQQYNGSKFIALVPIFVMLPHGDEEQVFLPIYENSKFEWTTGGPDEEGYSYTTVEIEVEDDIVWKKVSSTMCDCDGPLDTFLLQYWDTALGGWYTRESSRRDHWAEQAGY